MSNEIKYMLFKAKNSDDLYEAKILLNQLDPYNDGQELYIGAKEDAINKDGKLLYYLTDDGYVGENINAMGFENEHAKRFKEAADKFDFPEIKYTPDYDEIYCYVTKTNLDQAIKQMTQIINKIYRQLDLDFVKRSSKKIN